MSISVELARKMEALDPVLKDVLYTVISEIEKSREEAVSKKEFNELGEIIKKLAIKIGELAISQKELAEAQKRTEIKIEELAEAQKRTEVTVEELAEAQKRTEERLDRLTVTVEELAEAQNRTDKRLDRLTATVEELAKAQKRTEERLNSLAVTVEELAEAQKGTESSIQELIKAHQETRKMLGGLSHTVGFSLENEAYKALPELLNRDFNIKVKEKLIRKHLKDGKGKEIEINIFGKASRHEKDILIIGEGKCHLSKNDIDHFIKSRLRKLEVLYQEEIFPIIITHMTTGMDVEEYGKSKGIAIYYSYDF